MATAIEELKKYPNWVCWREQKHHQKDKVKKPIISAVTGKNGSHSNPNDWTTYEKAKAFYYLNKDRLSLKGLGFVFSDDTPFAGVDLDNCVENGELNAFARRLVKTFNSYTEWSHSGEGVHIIGRTKLLFRAVTSNRNGNEIEIYSKDRYFVITGKHLEGTPETLEDITTQLAYRVDAIQSRNPHQTPQHNETSIHEVVSALSHIPGDGLDYNEWLRILMSVHSAFPGADGLAAVENWTGQYCQPNELQQKWNSFRAGGIGIGTLFHFAKEHGYEVSPKPDKIRHSLERIKPRLSAIQEAQVQELVEELAEQRAWEIYHSILMKNHLDAVDLPAPILEHLQIGWREKEINKETGEIRPSAITIPYYIGNNEVVGIEFRNEEGIEYDGEVGLYEVKPMFDEVGKFGIIVPDSLKAIKAYLSGEGVASVFGLPHTTMSIELPDMELFCIFDSDTPVESLEVLDAYGAKFTKVPNVDTLLNQDRRLIELVARRGKKLSGVI